MNKTKAQLREDLAKARRLIRKMEAKAIARPRRPRSEETLQGVIVRTMAEGVCLVRISDATIVFANPRFENMFGYGPGEMNGMPVHRVNAETDGRDAAQVARDIIAQLESSGEAVYEVLNVRKDGTAFWCRAHTVRLDHPELGSVWVAVHEDITEHKLAEARLRESEEKYRSIFNNSIDAILLTAPDGGILAANPMACRIFDRTEGEICRLGRNGIIDTSDPRLAQAVEERALTGSFHGELTGLRADGARFPVEVSTSVFQDRRGQSRTSMIIRDISKRRKAEEALRESEKRYRQLVELSPDAIAVHSEGKIVFVNPAAIALMGAKSAADLLGWTALEIVHPDFRDLARERIRESISSNRPATPTWEKFVRLDGTAVDVEVMAAPIVFQGKAALQVIARDITERRKAEAALDEVKARLREVLANAPITIFAMDDQGIFTLSEGKGLERVGLKPGENVGSSAFDLYGSIPFVEVSGNVITGKDVIRRVLAGKTVNAVDEVRGVYFDNFIGPIRDATGRVIGVVGVATDITERKRVEKAFLESEERFRELFETMTSGATVYEAVEDGRDFIIKDFNAAGERIEGIGRDRLIGRRITEAFPGVASFGLLDVLRRVWTTGIPETLPVSYYRDGRTSGWRDNRVFRLPSREVVAVYDDVTARIQAEEKLKDSHEQLQALSSKLESIREEEKAHIAREIHDDLGQRLTGLLMDLSMLSKKLPTDLKSLREKAESMAEEVDALIKAVRRISTELRPGILDDLGLVPAVEWLCGDFLRPHGIRYALDFEIQASEISRERITGVFRIVQEALTNVVRHAQASVVTIGLKENPDDWVLSIEDNGLGFEPAGISASASLGLLGMRERARYLRGKIDIRSAPGKGTSIVLTIPKKTGPEDEP